MHRFTDGLENTAPTIASVQGSIDHRTFAIGLGNAAQVSTAALHALANGTGGYLLLTGDLSASVDDYFRLSKFFLQILAGVTNTTIVTDPSGFLGFGPTLRIPFALNEADIDTTVILLEDLEAIHLRVETPHGDVIDPAVAAGFGGTYADGTRLSYYRLTLPVPLGGGEPVAAGGGWWSAETGPGRPRASASAVAATTAGSLLFIIRLSFLASPNGRLPARRGC
jgi:hypothetical protein